MVTSFVEPIKNGNIGCVVQNYKILEVAKAEINQGKVLLYAP